MAANEAISLLRQKARMKNEVLVYHPNHCLQPDDTEYRQGSLIEPELDSSTLPTHTTLRLPINLIFSS